MKHMYLDVSKDLCVECSMALRRFIGKMDGVDSINVENGQVVIQYDEQKMKEDFLRKLTNESLSKLGYQKID